MAHSKIFFIHPVSRKVREAPVGFSWTTLFFGPFVPLFRRDFAMFFIMVTVHIITYGLDAFYGLDAATDGFGAINWLGVVYFCFAYNKIYIKKLISNGFLVENSTISMKILRKNLGIDNSMLKNLIVPNSRL